jgi:hypothetical protein
MDNDIPLFNIIKEVDMLFSVLNKLSDKNTQQDEDSDMEKKQN